MKVIRNNIIPLRGYKAVNIMGVLFVRKDAMLRDTDYNHEAIHTAQIKELLYVGFYLWYAVEWAVRLLRNGFKAHEAYRSIAFEREAYENQGDTAYLSSRKRFAFISYE